MDLAYSKRKDSRASGGLHAIPWIVIFCGLIFLGAFAHLELVAVALSFIACFIFVACAGNTSGLCISTCLWLLLLQNAMVGLGAHLGGNTSSDLSLLTQVPFLLIASVFCGTLILSGTRYVPRKGGFQSKWIKVLVFLICALFLFGGASINAKLVAVRNLLMFYMGYKLAFNQCCKQGECLKVMKQLTVVGVVATVFGILMMLQDVSFWQSIGIYEVYIAKQSPIQENSLGGRFYTSLNGVTDVMRMGSLYYEPVNLAYLLLAALIASFFLWRSKQTIFLTPVLIGVGLALTFGKGGYMLLAFLVVAYLGNKLLSALAGKTMHETRFVSYLICFAVIGTIAYTYYRVVGGPVKPHFWAIEQTMSSILSNPIGHGIGSGGNMSGVVGASRYARGAESAIMTFGYQIGVLGILSVFMILRDIADFAPKTDSLSAVTAYYLPLALFAVSVLQENTFSPQCIFPMMVLVAALQRFAMGESELNEVIRDCAYSKT